MCSGSPVPTKTAKPSTISAAITDWVTEAMCGLFHFGWVGECPGQQPLAAE